ncbi:DUF1775 domain-containing protein [Kitasatospora camelliae]|uniref:DUF1775 domain-containing protein n=1 Tax=Kitasatospora camelliae TaxID=3156397 RepID=A0AAU8JSS6_9ACTN
MTPSRLLGRAAAIAVVAAGFLAPAVPALAHVEVEAQPARALVTEAAVTFTGEAESQTAGIAEVRVVLPEGIAPGDVTLARAPQGWTLTATADGYTVGGPALDSGEDAVHTITVRQLPNAPQLVFKTVETYGDGRVDRWIELPQNGATPEHPAPVLALAPAAPGATPLPLTASASGPAPDASPQATPSPSPHSPQATPSPSSASSAPASGGGGGGSPAVPLAVAAAIVVVAAAGARWWRRSRGSAGR